MRCEAEAMSDSTAPDALRTAAVLIHAMVKSAPDRTDLIRRVRQYMDQDRLEALCDAIDAIDVGDGRGESDANQLRAAISEHPKAKPVEQTPARHGLRVVR